jgi:uncharacterized protein YjbI with pentapeptide repeats
MNREELIRIIKARNKNNKYIEPDDEDWDWDRDGPYYGENLTEDISLENIDLHGANLAGAYLSDLNFHGANL